MRIAFYCPNKPLAHPDPSGDWVIAGGIRNALNGLGHDCREIVSFRSRWFWKSYLGWTEAFKSFFKAFSSALRFRPHLWLTYHTYYKSPDLHGPRISRLLNIPYILFQPIYSTKRRKTAGTRTGFYLNRIALKACRHSFTNNLRDLEALRRIIPSQNITYLPPGIFPEDFRRDEASGRAVRRDYGIPQETPLLMTAAMLRPDVKFQSMTYLLRSLSLIGKKQFPFMLLVVGDGPMRADLHAAAQNLLPGRVVFAGRVDRSIMYRYYSAADLFVFPGIGESLGMVFLEAQACGLPVIALNTAGVPQVVRQGETGLLVTEDDGEAMAKAVEKLLSEPQIRTRMASNGSKFIREERNLHCNYRELSQKLEEIVGIQRH